MSTRPLLATGNWKLRHNPAKRGRQVWSEVRQDIGYALRTLSRSGWFAATAIVTLALGIGANTAIFSIISGVMLRKQPYRESERLAFLWSTTDAFPREALTPGRLVDFRTQLTTVSGLAGI